MKKVLIRNLVYITSPPLLALVASRVINVSILILTIIFYGGLLLFLLPSDVLFGNTLDYHTKAANPTYRPERKEFEPCLKSDLFSIIIVLICLVGTIVWYFR
ncbi:hypothetical protein [Enterococcus gilvus]|uniref:hypothetical protein n=1 Tax=Enterococcus gilvus TaxID=160453 RepID=UPI001C8B757D|nr:hypothetical protein [Enterococcus gilvus]